MVDLVKIRKKAKEKKEKGEAPPPEAAPETAEVGVATVPLGGTAHAGLKPGTTLDSPAPQRTPNKLERFLESAGTKRETASAAPVAATAEREVLTFVLDREHYAVDIERVVSIIATRPVTRIPNADASILGIISLRGTVVTLLDVRSKLGHPNVTVPAADRRVIIMDFQSESIGFEVDRVLRVVKVNPEDIEPHPVVHASEADDSIAGVFRHGDALTILLDFDKLLGSRGPVSVVRGRSAGVRAPRS